MGLDIDVTPFFFVCTLTIARIHLEGESTSILPETTNITLRYDRNGRKARRANGSLGAPLRRCAHLRRDDEAAATDLPASGVDSAAGCERNGNLWQRYKRPIGERLDRERS